MAEPVKTPIESPVPLIRRLTDARRSLMMSIQRLEAPMFRTRSRKEVGPAAEAVVLEIELTAAALAQHVVALDSEV